MRAGDDTELVRRCQAGDLSAFDDLMVRYEKKVYSLCYRMARDPDDAADLAQEAFIKVYRALPAFRGRSSFSTWLFRIVTNTCLDDRRHRGSRPSLVSLDRTVDTGDGEMTPELPGDGPDPPDCAEKAETQAEIRVLLALLPAEQRLVLVMRDMEGYSYEEIAEVLGLNIGTVKSRINRARARLREIYQKKEEHLGTVLHLKGKRGWSHEL
jgi:RNA polymerase sigma-70 factor (ECF subfamily)